LFTRTSAVEAQEVAARPAMRRAAGKSKFFSLFMGCSINRPRFSVLSIEILQTLRIVQAPVKNRKMQKKRATGSEHALGNSLSRSELNWF
jgi:hypothetical protein